MTETYLTDERLMIQEVARDFTRREVLPVANELDPIQGEIPMDLRNKMGEMGYFGIRMPEEQGGLGLGVFEYCLIAEELARGWMSVASIIARAASLMNVGGWPLEKREELTAKAAKGEYLAAISLSEPNVGSDLASVSCRAVLDGDQWVITGNKYWCTFADGADYIQLLARVEAPADNAAGYSGLKNFIIEKPRGELPEGCSGSPIPKIGYFGWKTWELFQKPTSSPAAAVTASRTRCTFSMRRGLTPRRAPSGLPGARWKTPWPTPTSGCNSACPLPTSRKPASRLRAWPARSKQLDNSCITPQHSSIAVRRPKRKRRWSSGTRVKWPSG
jgi:alkylation response protein AidB-like acyl-CoA dehydrogenase